MPAASMTGWVLTVSLRSSTGPSSTSFQRSWPIASEASENVLRTPESCAKDFIMPIDWEPCPGNTNAIFMGSRSPAHQNRAPGEAAAYAFQEQRLAGKNAAVSDGLVQCQRNGCRRSVAVMMNGGNQLFPGQSDFPGRSLHDPDVRLVRDKPIQVRYVQSGDLQHFIGPFLKDSNRKLEDCAAIHMHERRAGHFAAVYAAGHTQHFLVTAVGMQFRREDPRLFTRGNNDGAGTVAEQDAGAAIAPVENARIHLRAHYQRVPGLTGTDEQVRNGEPVDKAAAYCLHVECGTARDSQFGLQNASRAGKYDVRRCCGNNNEIDVCAVQARRLQCLLRGMQCQIARQLTFRSHVAAVYARAGPDPFVRGIDCAREIVVGHDFCRQIASGADDSRKRHAARW